MTDEKISPTANCILVVDAAPAALKVMGCFMRCIGFISPGDRNEYYEIIDSSMEGQILLVKIMSALGSCNCCCI